MLWCYEFLLHLNVTKKNEVEIFLDKMYYGKFM